MRNTRNSVTANMTPKRGHARNQLLVYYFLLFCPTFSLNSFLNAIVCLQTLAQAIHSYIWPITQALNPRICSGERWYERKFFYFFNTEIKQGYFLKIISLYFSEKSRKGDDFMWCVKQSEEFEITRKKIRSQVYWHSIVRLETRPIRLEVSAPLFLLASQRISDTLVCYRVRFKWKHLPTVFTIVCDMPT